MKRMIKRIGLILLVLLIALVAHILLSTGYFRTVNNEFSGKIVKKIPITGPEDITVNWKESFAITSATNREIYPPVKEETGGLSLMDLKKPEF
ncbi:hypothetical protein ACWGOQ_0020585 [Aquimarina sp. M1]